MIASLSIQAQVYNVYGNLNWIQDQIEGFHYYAQVGPTLRKTMRTAEDYQLLLEPGLDDSSSYSRLKYDIGGNANQRLQAYLLRPLSKDLRFDFYVDRQSYPGWMSSSFSRETDIKTSVEYGKRKGLQASFSLVIESFDRELNGGLESDTHTISGQNGNFNAISSGVFWTDAFSRSTMIETSGSLGYSFSNDAGSELSIYYEPTFKWNKFLFDQSSVDSTYYNEEFGVTTDIVTFRDSNRLVQWENTVRSETSLHIDSGRTLNASIGLSGAYVEYFTNNSQRFFENWSVHAHMNWYGLKNQITASTNYYWSGLNQGDFGLKFIQRYTIFEKKDSASNSAIRLGTKANFSKNNPSLIYSSYQSEILTLASNLNKIQRLDAKAFLEVQQTRFQLTLGASYENMLNWVYLDNRLNVQQHNAEIQVISPELTIGYFGNVFRTSFAGKYQHHKRSRIYSMPDWVLQSDIGIRFPMFKKKLYFTTGVDGWYFSKYFARGYIPFMDLMYVQNDRKYGEYVQINPFLKVHIQTVRITLKYLNAGYGLITDDPIVGPGYPSVPRYIQFSVDWTFKN